MKNLLNPKWILFLNSIPLLILSFILYNDYSIIKSLLDEETHSLWFKFSGALLLLFVGNLAFAIYHFIKKTELNYSYAIYSSIFYLVYLYCYFQYIDEIVPSTIPDWMISGNLFLHMGTFIMPTLIHSILIFTLIFTKDIDKASALKNFLALIAIPIIAYLSSQIGLPILHQIDTNFSIHFIIIAFILTTFLFLFFLIRLFYILILKKGYAWKKYQLAWKIPVCILFPILGLLINNGVSSFSQLFVNTNGIFGNFSSPWFYLFAIVNGVLLCLPKFKNHQSKLLLFVLKTILFTYIVYFFLVFLPYLPFALLAIIALGTGFLMLTPIMIFVIQSIQLYNDFNDLTSQFSKKTLLIIAVVAFSVLPTTITFNYIQDKYVIKETLEYVYNPDFEKEYKIDIHSLENTLFSIKASKKSKDSFVFGENLPYLNTYFNWLVLDNLTLSETKLNHIERIFFGEKNKSGEFFNNSTTKDNVTITKAKSNSVYDEKQHAWKSTIDLEITNHDRDLSEYATKINLPEGCYISDYYLYVGDKKEYGLLTEKKSALWVFNNIRNENKDPGLLYYLNKNTIAFKVFPFAINETRKTGIEILHKEPISLTIDDENFTLGDSLQHNNNLEIKNAFYVTATAKKNLQKVIRKPYYHFVVDASIDISNKATIYTDIIEDIIEKQPLEHKSKISLVNSFTETFDYSSNWKENYTKNTFKDGFYLDRGIKNILFETYKNQGIQTYPIIVVLSNNLNKAIIENNFSNYTSNYYESEFFYTINADYEITSHSLVNNPLETVNKVSSIPSKNTISCLKYEQNGQTYLLKDDNQLSVLTNATIDFDNTSNKNWENGIKMQAQYLHSIFYPKEYQKEWIELIRASFASHIMNQYTSFIVVENEAQKAALLSKQQKVLSGNKALDLDEETPQMSEPSLLLLLAIVLLFFYYKKIH